MVRRFYKLDGRDDVRALDRLMRTGRCERARQHQYVDLRNALERLEADLEMIRFTVSAEDERNVEDAGSRAWPRAWQSLRCSSRSQP